MSKIVTGAEYLALPREPETFLIDPLLPVGGSMLLYGDPKIGKSYAALQLACNLATGSPWLGFHIPEAHPVVYVQLDTPRSLWASRVEDLAGSGHEVHAVHQADRETLGTFPFDILNDEHFGMFREAIAGVNPGAVVIDTVRECHSGDENDSTAMQQVVARLDAAIRPAAMILIAHARKSNAEQGYDLLNDSRGSNYIVGRMDAICRFSKSTMRLTSRTLEEQSLKLERIDDGTWELARDPWIATAEEMCMLHPDLSGRELARLLHQLDKSHSEAACRNWIQRYRKSQAKSR